MDVLLETPHLNPPPLRNVTHFFSIFILQVLRLSVVYKSMKVHLGQSQELIMSMEIYLKCKYTHENAGFCILCIDDFKIIKIFYQAIEIFHVFYRETSQAPPPPTPNVHMTFLVDKIDM